jgi:serine/threonine-protein kinase HipA
VAHKAGVDVPGFDLSRDGRVLRIARFDRSPKGPLGFEDFCVLQGLNASQKYDSTCERLVATAALFAPSVARAAIRHQAFRRLVLSGMLRNGDGHLKNWGVLYRTPGDVALAPTYDIVTTTAYRVLRNDVPALMLAGRRAWRLERGTWTRFAQQHCALDPGDARAIVDEVAAAVRSRLRILAREASRAGSGHDTLAAMHAQWTAGVEDTLAVV